MQYFPAILDADPSGQGTHPPAETNHHQDSVSTYYDSDIRRESWDRIVGIYNTNHSENLNARVVGRDAADDQEPDGATGLSCFPPDGSEEEISELLAGIYNFELDNAGSIEASGSSSTRYNTNS